MRSELRDEAIVLKRIAYGEADLIVTFFARGRGRMSGIARAAKKSVRRFGGALEPGTLVEISYSEKGGATLANLREVRVIRPVLGLVKSLGRIEALARAIELALAFLQEHQRSDEKFALLSRRIEYLCENEPSPLDCAIYDIEWLRFAGFGPYLAGCSICDTKAGAGGGWAFGLDHGGLLCGVCAGRVANCIRLADNAMQGFEHLHVAGTSAEAQNLHAARAVIGNYIEYVLGRALHTTDKLGSGLTLGRIEPFVLMSSLTPIQ